MDTDQLIRTLAADNASPARPVGAALAIALLLAAPITIVGFFAVLGFRPDIDTAIYNPFFDLKFVVTLSLAAAAIVVGLHLSRPEASLRGWLWLLLIPLALLVCGIAGDDAAVAALAGAADREKLTGLHDGDPGPVDAAARRGADRIAARSAGAASTDGRSGRHAVGGLRRDALRIAMHRRFPAVRDHLVFAGDRAGRSHRRAGRLKIAAVLEHDEMMCDRSLSTSLRGAIATKQSSSCFGFLDCFAALAMTMQPEPTPL
jgi:hypothetical protein